jgi:hypothetical protein
MVEYDVLGLGFHRSLPFNGRHSTSTGSSSTSTPTSHLRITNRLLEKCRWEACRSSLDIGSRLPRYVLLAFTSRPPRLKPGSGVLSCLDGYMNIALEQTEEHVNGIVTNRYGDAFIRGNNGPIVFLCIISFLTSLCVVLYISAAEPL